MILFVSYILSLRLYILVIQSKKAHQAMGCYITLDIAIGRELYNTLKASVLYLLFMSCDIFEAADIR